MAHSHVCYMYSGSIYNSEGCIIEEPAILVDRNTGVLHGWGNMDVVKAKFDRFAAAYSDADMGNELESLMMIELSKYKVTREMACYIMRRAVEFTASGFIEALCRELAEGENPAAWLKAEMERLPLDLGLKEDGI